MRALRNRDRRTCDSVRGQRTTPWAPCIPEPDPEPETAPGIVAVGGGGVVGGIVVDDDLHHHGNWAWF